MESRAATENFEGLTSRENKELVLHSAKIQYKNYDKAVIVSGDGDFFCLHEDLEKEKKLFKIIVPSRKGELSLLKRFRDYKLYVEEMRAKVEMKQKRRLRIQHEN